MGERLTREDWRNSKSVMWERVDELKISEKIKEEIKAVLRKLAEYEDREENQNK